MTTYKCNACARTGGDLTGFVTGSLLGSIGQQQKHAKHTQLPTTYALTSIFSDPSTKAYESFIVSASCSGTLEIDDLNRKNVIVFAGQKAGALYKNGRFELDQNSVKVVQYDNPSKIHAFPTGSTGASTAKCSVCGQPTPI